MASDLPFLLYCLYEVSSTLDLRREVRCGLA